MIDSYEFGKIVIDGRQYSSDLIIFPDHVKENWWRKSGHDVLAEDLGEAIAAKPEIIIIGTGKYGRARVPEETRRHLESLGIKLIVESTDRAVSTYNKLSRVKKVIAALHLTC